MSDDQDHESQTEDASEKRLGDAIERGERPVSRDVVSLTVFAAFVFALSATWSRASMTIGEYLIKIFSASGQLRFEGREDATKFLTAALWRSLSAIAPFVAIMALASVAAFAAQGELRFAAKRIAPDLSRISPMKGFGRLLSKRGMTEFLKACAKLGICAGAAYLAFKKRMFDILDSGARDPASLGAFIVDLCLYLTVWIASALAVVAAFDFFIVRMFWRRSLRMTKQDVKDEMKQSEGDPYVKARLRSLAMDRSRRRMLVDVERATLVVANPVHYAIALRYVREEGGAPTVLAKGQELVALKIRERAEQCGVPVVENPLLARAMYDHMEIGQMIPQQFYRAIAEIINLLAKGKSADGVRV